MNLEPYVTEYTIEAFPGDTRNGHHWRFRIKLHRDCSWSDRTWIVTDDFEYLHRTQPIKWTTDRAQALLFRDLDTAVAAAQKALRKQVVGETTWSDMVAKWGTP